MHFVVDSRLRIGNQAKPQESIKKTRSNGENCEHSGALFRVVYKSDLKAILVVPDFTLSILAKPSPPSSPSPKDLASLTSNLFHVILMPTSTTTTIRVPVERLSDYVVCWSFYRFGRYSFTSAVITSS